MKPIKTAAIHCAVIALGALLLAGPGLSADVVPAAIERPLERRAKRFEQDFIRDPGDLPRSTRMVGAFTFAKKIHLHGSRFDGQWLFSYEIADSGEREPFHTAVTSIADAGGKVAWRLPGQPGLRYYDGLVVWMAPGECLVALGTDIGHSGDGLVELWSTGGKTHPVAIFDGMEGSVRRWMSMLYFVDIDHDGRKEVVINRLLWFGDGKIFNEKCVYRLSRKTGRLVRQDFSREELRSLVARCKRDSRVPHILQACLLEGTQPGEKIFPDGDNDLHYLDTGLPDVLPPDVSPIGTRDPKPDYPR